MDDRPQCAGMTVVRTFSAGSGRPDIPSRRCRSKARRGRKHCAQHEPDQEFSEAVRREGRAEEERLSRLRDQRLRDDRAEWQHAVRLRLAQLSKTALTPDANPRRCTAVGVLSWEYWDGWDMRLPELVQCDGYLGHPVGKHICLEEVDSYGMRSVKWRD